MREVSAEKPLFAVDSRATSPERAPPRLPYKQEVACSSQAPPTRRTPARRGLSRPRPRPARGRQQPSSSLSSLPIPRGADRVLGGDPRGLVELLDHAPYVRIVSTGECPSWRPT